MYKIYIYVLLVLLIFALPFIFLFLVVPLFMLATYVLLISFLR